MIGIIRTSTRRQLNRTISALHDRASTEQTQRDSAQHRIDAALQLLDDRGVPRDDALRLTLTGDTLSDQQIVIVPKCQCMCCGRFWRAWLWTAVALALTPLLIVAGGTYPLYAVLLAAVVTAGGVLWAAQKLIFSVQDRHEKPSHACTRNDAL